MLLQTRLINVSRVILILEGYLTAADIPARTQYAVEDDGCVGEEMLKGMIMHSVGVSQTIGRHTLVNPHKRKHTILPTQAYCPVRPRPRALDTLATVCEA